MKEMTSWFVLALACTLAACSCDVPQKFSTEDAVDSIVPDLGEQGEFEILPDQPVEEVQEEEMRICWSSSECSDLEPCNGTEACSEAGVCVPGERLADGTACVSSSGTSGVCWGGYCVPGDCGNGITDSGEECDDGNAVPGDGCEPTCVYSCHESAECDTGNPCSIGSCTANDSGQLCTYSYPVGPCNDGNDCTGADTCDGAGSCIGSGNPCNDGIECTQDLCEIGPAGAQCNFPAVPGFCAFAGQCITEGTENPESSCQECNTVLSSYSWSLKADMSICLMGIGICCAGRCFTGGQCCTSADCPAACRGTAAPCDTFNSQMHCDNQSGCSWGALGTCTGDSSACGDLRAVPMTTCIFCGCNFVNCRMDGGNYVCDCTGDGFPCSSFGDGEDSCSGCGCSWMTTVDGCAGNHDPCDSYATAAGCGIQTGCSWSAGTCTTGHSCQ